MLDELQTKNKSEQFNPKKYGIRDPKKWRNIRWKFTALLRQQFCFWQHIFDVFSPRDIDQPTAPAIKHLRPVQNLKGLLVEVNIERVRLI